MTFIIPIFFLFVSGLLQAETQSICSTVVVHGSVDLNLSETEKRMACGDSKLEAYNDIPPAEAKFFLQGFLQSRGHLRPRFEKKGEVLHVHIGPRAYVEKINVLAAVKKEAQFIKREIARLYRKKVLNPALLNSMEAEARSLLRQRGFPCAKVSTQVDALKESITLQLSQLVSFDFGKFEREKIEGLSENALNRYYPFRPEMTFNEQLLTLAEKRMLRAEVVQGTYFLENCSDGAKDFSFSQNFIVGPPRTIRFGVGASTELGPMARIRWSHNRLGSMASVLSANLQSSLRSQSLTVAGDFFIWDAKPRRSILTEFEVLRESQIDYEQLITGFSPQVKWTRDLRQHHHLYTLGPSFESGTYHSKVSPTKSYATGTIEAGLQFMSHDYEIYDIHPQTGDFLNLNLSYRNSAFGFSDQLLKLDSSFVQLARLANLGMGAVIGGARINAGTSWVSSEVTAKGLPPAVKFYGGGSDDVRGYHLRTLPRNDGLGALSKVGLKLELRRTRLFHESLEAFAFVDQAFFGDSSWTLKSPLYYSPGLGLRWLSPIGLVQVFYARALTASPAADHGHLIFLGLGGVF